MNKTVTVKESFRDSSKKRGSRKQRISWANNMALKLDSLENWISKQHNSILANSEVMPATQQRFMNVLCTKVGWLKLKENSF
jgi:hypothetical protein